MHVYRIVGLGPSPCSDQHNKFKNRRNKARRSARSSDPPSEYMDRAAVSKRDLRNSSGTHSTALLSGGSYRRGPKEVAEFPPQVVESFPFPCGKQGRGRFVVLGQVRINHGNVICRTFWDGTRRRFKIFICTIVRWAISRENQSLRTHSVPSNVAQVP